MEMFNSYKFFIVFASISTQFILGEGFFAALKDIYIFDPSRKGCVACIKSADKHFLKGITSLKSDCTEAKNKYTKFKALGSTSYCMFHICKEDNKKEYQNRLNIMTAKAKKVLEEFEKCVLLTLDFGQKSSIKDLWEKFKTERNECGSTNHLTAEFQTFWDKLPYTGMAEAVWGITPENADLISNLIT